jgi:hypothetical protein
MPPDTLTSCQAHAHEVPSPELMDEDPLDDEALYEQLTGRAGNWELTQRPRPYHHPGRLIAGVIYNVIRWVSLGIVAYVGWKYIQSGERVWMEYALGAFVTFIIFQIASYSNGLNTHCPLCHGTPLHEKRCHKHRLANKFLFFNHKTSTILSILTRGRFNCMYCGTPFRLKK